MATVTLKKLLEKSKSFLRIYGMKTKTITFNSIEHHIGLPIGKHIVVSVPQHDWLYRWLNREGCLVWLCGGTIYLKDMPRAKRKLAQALELLPEPGELVLDPKWSDQE